MERARYEAECARRRYMHVDPTNRLVADSLEGEWNDKLHRLSEAQDDYERGRQTGELYRKIGFLPLFRLHTFADINSYPSLRCLIESGFPEPDPLVNMLYLHFP